MGGVITWQLRGPRTVALLVAVGVLVVVELAVRWATAGMPPPLRFADAHVAHRAALMAEAGPVDVAFVGTSSAWQAFDPATFTEHDPLGRSAFNAGLQGAVPVVTGPWLTGHVAPSLQPDVVVWGLTSLDLSPSFGAQALAAWESAPAGRPGLLGAVERAAASGSILVARRAQLRRPTELVGAGAAGAAQDMDAAVAGTAPDGWRLRQTPGRGAEQQAIQRARLAGWTPDPADLDAVVEAVLEMHADGIEVVLAELPVPPALVALHPRGSADVAEARQAMAALSQVTGAPLAPAGEGWADADFSDLTHLTPAASRRFTAAVAESLPDVMAGTGPDVLAGEVVEGDAVPVPPATQDPATPAPDRVPPPTAIPTTPPSVLGTPAAPPPTVAAPSTPPPPAPAPPAPPAPAPPAPPPAPPPPPAPTTRPVSAWVDTPEATAVGQVLSAAALAQVGCAGGAVDEALVGRARAGVADLDDPGFADGVRTLLDRAVALRGTCTDEAGWRAAMADVLTATEVVVRGLEAALGAEASAGGAAQVARTASTPDLAVHVTHAYERLEWLLDGADMPRLTRNEMWWSFAQRGHVDALMRASLEGRAVETIVLGTSQAHTGVIAERLGEATGQEVFNAYIDGGTIDVGRVWVERVVLDLVTADRAVVVVSGIDLLSPTGQDCATRSRDDFSAALDRASAAFRPVPFLQAHEPLALTSATRGAAAPPLQSPLVPAYAPDPALDYLQRTEEQMYSGGRAFLAAYRQDTVCADRMAALRAVVAGLRSEGTEVLVVAAPIRTPLREAAPDGAVAALDDRIAALAEDEGASFLSATALLPDEEMVDFVHVTRRGAEILTDEIAQALRNPLADALGVGP